MEEAGIDHAQVSLRTVTRYLNSKGYFYLQARKKGLMSVEDHKKRVKFAKHMRRNYCPDVWKKDMCFFLDGTSLTYKRNPLDQALAPQGRVWRKKARGWPMDAFQKVEKKEQGASY